MPSLNRVTLIGHLGADLLAKAGGVRADKGMICAIGGYPATGCAAQLETLTEAQKAPDTALTLPTAAPTTAPTATTPVATTTTPTTAATPTATATAAVVATSTTAATHPSFFVMPIAKITQGSARHRPSHASSTVQPPSSIATFSTRPSATCPP